MSLLISVAEVRKQLQVILRREGKTRQFGSKKPQMYPLFFFSEENQWLPFFFSVTAKYSDVSPA